MFDFNDYSIANWVVNGYLQRSPEPKKLNSVARPHAERDSGNLKAKATASVVAFVAFAGLLGPVEVQVELPRIRTTVPVSVVGTAAEWLTESMGDAGPSAEQPALAGMDAELAYWFRYATKRFAGDLEILGNA